MRTKRALINTLFGIFNQVILAILNIIIRKFMIANIGIEYLGVNGLFSNILSLLSLTESGFGMAITYKLYKPISENDEEKMGQLLNFYNQIYNVIAFVIIIIGLLITPFLPSIIKQTSIPMKNIYFYYILFLINSVAGYFLAYKTAFLIACQKNYHVLIINTVVTIIMAIIKIFSITVLKDYICYLFITIFNTLLVNIVISFFTNKQYPFIRNIKKSQLLSNEKKLIFKDCKAIMYHKIGAYVLNGTDNILISAFVNITMVGLYSNYLMIINLLNSIISKFFDAIIPAVGDKLATEGEKATYEAFKMISFFNFIIQFFCTGMLLSLLQPFILFLFGKECLLDSFTVFLLGINFFFIGMRRPVGTVKNASGVFYQDRYWALVEAIINLVVSIIGVKTIGLPGIFIGTIISGLLVPNIAGPYYLYRDIFCEKFKNYIFKNLEYYFIMIIALVPIVLRINIIQNNYNFYSFVIIMIFFLIIWVSLSVLVVLILPERKYALKYLKTIKQFKNIK